MAGICWCQDVCHTMWRYLLMWRCISKIIKVAQTIYSLSVWACWCNRIWCYVKVVHGWRDLFENCGTDLRWDRRSCNAVRGPSRELRKLHLSLGSFPGPSWGPTVSGETQPCEHVLTLSGPEPEEPDFLGTWSLRKEPAQLVFFVSAGRFLWHNCDIIDHTQQIEWDICLKNTFTCVSHVSPIKTQSVSTKPCRLCAKSSQAVPTPQKSPSLWLSLQRWWDSHPLICP